MNKSGISLYVQHIVLMVICGGVLIIYADSRRETDTDTSATSRDAAHLQPVKVTPTTASCGQDPGHSEFILNSPWDFGPLHGVFSGGKVVRCASQCKLRHPQTHHIQQLVALNTAINLGHPNCTPSISELNPQHHCFRDVKYNTSGYATYSLWIKPQSTNTG